ncbi:MAG: TraB family protein [Candidatus Woesearchaeota archaeon]
MHYKNLFIIGTSHISKDSVNEIKKRASELNPDIIAIELDKHRLSALISNAKPDYSIKNISKIGFKGYLFAIIGGYFQKKLGEIVGVKPGSDMYVAVKFSQENHKILALIDQDINITLKKLSKNIKFKEKIRFIWDLLTSWFQPKIKIDISKVPEDELVRQLMRILKKNYPNIYYTLVDERNKIMSRRLVKLMRENPDKKILCVIGAGHKEELMKMVKNIFESENFELF